MNRFHVASTLVVAAIGLIAPVTFADTVPGEAPNLNLQWFASSNGTPIGYNANSFGTPVWGLHQLGGNPDGSNGPERERLGWRYQAAVVDTIGQNWTMDWDCVVNEDPFVDATINVTNTSSTTQTFWIYMPLLIAPPIPGGTIMNGFVSATVNSASFGGATLAASPANPVYQAYIDAVPLGGVAQMWHPGYSMTTGPFGSNNDFSSFSNEAGPGALLEIAIRLQFTLSAGDSASVTGAFEILPIPSPAGLPLFAIFGALAVRGRRR